MLHKNIYSNMDSQGRIVIPSEIRKRLHITGGDSLEIRSNGQDIRLRKCDASASHDPQFQKFLTVLYDSIRHGVFLCDTETVYSAKGIYLPDGTPIPKELSDIVAGGKETVFDLNHPIYIVPYIKEPAAALFPISGTDASPLALVILCRHQEPLSEMELGSAKLVAATMTRHFI
ncbi:AbrB/MazE/SpoVT family DNA-binding domain-containing protein [Enterocloster clostridioformis]|uniref:AbrB/MazE/SpoVT family DNA-binding domain-containing protein n=1 Tax=Enterocloster clostridioformis TaxID=1531 RepID=UPI001313EE58|nr:AbrB/MazE/SpoVT family DNA-binding domain-containing protein [Enterocloster clostridioformis]QQR03661.1 AbrB/MazE/SpoVT family DNA-binding domain-containing protein [Enterocloster clostridioformis]